MQSAAVGGSITGGPVAQLVSNEFGLPDPFGSALNSAGAGGWAAILGKSPTDKLTPDDVTLIGNYVYNKIASDPLFFAIKNNPLTGAAATSQLMAVHDEVLRTLAGYVGRSIGDLPNDLRGIDAIRNSYGVDSVTNFGDGLVKGIQESINGGLVLLGIVSVGLMGLYLMFRPSTSALGGGVAKSFSVARRAKGMLL